MVVCCFGGLRWLCPPSSSTSSAFCCTASALAIAVLAGRDGFVVGLGWLFPFPPPLALFLVLSLFLASAARFGGLVVLSL